MIACWLSVAMITSIIVCVVYNFTARYVLLVVMAAGLWASNALSLSFASATFASMEPETRAVALAIILDCCLAVSASAGIRINGDVEGLEITTEREPISKVLYALSETFHLKHRIALPLDAPANTRYGGTLVQVIARLLDGYNYTVKRERQEIEIVVIGKRGETALPPAAGKDAAAKGIISRWR